MKTNLIITQDRSLIPACDVETLEEFKEILLATCRFDGIGAYKVGFELGLRFSLPKVVEVARGITDKPIIYDHQKAGTDLPIPITSRAFMKTCADAGINAVILFPLAGPETAEKWIKEAQDKELGVIVGGLMSHAKFLKTEGGFIDDEAPLKIYQQAAELGVSHFVVPGNKLDKVKIIKEKLKEIVKEPVFYVPGIGAQGGKILEVSKVLGPRWHAIVGRTLIDAIRHGMGNVIEALLGELARV